MITEMGKRQIEKNVPHFPHPGFFEIAGLRSSLSLETLYVNLFLFCVVLCTYTAHHRYVRSKSRQRSWISQHTARKKLDITRHKTRHNRNIFLLSRNKKTATMTIKEDPNDFKKAGYEDDVEVTAVPASPQGNEPPIPAGHARFYCNKCHTVSLSCFFSVASSNLNNAFESYPHTLLNRIELSPLYFCFESLTTFQIKQHLGGACNAWNSIPLLLANASGAPYCRLSGTISRNRYINGSWSSSRIKEN